MSSTLQSLFSHMDTHLFTTFAYQPRIPDELFGHNRGHKCGNISLGEWLCNRLNDCHCFPNWD